MMKRLFQITTIATCCLAPGPAQAQSTDICATNREFEHLGGPQRAYVLAGTSARCWLDGELRTWDYYAGQPDEQAAYIKNIESAIDDCLRRDRVAPPDGAAKYDKCFTDGVLLMQRGLDELSQAYGNDCGKLDFSNPCWRFGSQHLAEGRSKLDDCRFPAQSCSGPDSDPDGCCGTLTFRGNE
jgi:hypothetical protein